MKNILIISSSQRKNGNSCNSPLRMSKMKNCKKADSAAKTRLNQGFLKI